MEKLNFIAKWDFMNNPEIKEAQICFDDSSFFQDTEESRRESLSAFKSLFSSLLDSATKKARENNFIMLREVFKFIRTNMRALDRGGRSEQSNVLVEANKQIIDQFPEFWKKAIKELGE